MKKQFFTAAVACAAALSLSVSAFAANDLGFSDGDLGGSGIGESYQVVTVNENGETRVATSAGVGAIFPQGSLPTNIVSVKMEVVSEDASNLTTGDEAFDSMKQGLKDLGGDDTLKVNKLISITLTGTDKDGNQVPVTTFTRPITVVVVNDDVSNAIGYPEGADAEHKLLGLFIGETTSTFSTDHFSDFYQITVAEDVANTLRGGNTPPEETTTTTSKPTDLVPPGSGDNSGNAGETTTAAPANTTGSSDNGTGDGSFDIDFETTGGDTTNAPSDSGSTNEGGDNGNGNNGDTGNAGAGNDKNQATGVVLAVIPAAVAAAAVIISKKRK